MSAEGKAPEAGAPERKIIADVEDLLVDLVGTFNDARSRGETGIHSAVGSRFEARVRACADALQELSESTDPIGDPS